MRPQASQPEIFRSSVGVGPFSNDSQEESTGRKASVAAEPSPFRRRRDHGRAGLRSGLDTYIGSFLPQSSQTEIV